MVLLVCAVALFVGIPIWRKQRRGEVQAEPSPSIFDGMSPKLTINGRNVKAHQEKQWRAWYIACWAKLHDWGFPGRRDFTTWSEVTQQQYNGLLMPKLEELRLIAKRKARHKVRPLKTRREGRRILMVAEMPEGDAPPPFKSKLQGEHE